MKTLFLVDLVPTEITNPIFKQKNIDLLFSDALSLFQENDVNFVNLECALTDSATPIKK